MRSFVIGFLSLILFVGAGFIDDEPSLVSFNVENSNVVEGTLLAPTFTLSNSSITVDEDFMSTETVTVTPDNATLTVNYSLTPAPSTATFANVSIDENTGEITITSVPDEFGTINFTVTATEVGGTMGDDVSTQPFTLTVNSVNDAPEFTLSSPSIIADEDFVGTESVTVTPGTIPTNELAQTVIYSLSPDPSMVSFANISINSATGEISASAVADASGSLSFTVMATDDGGTPGVNMASQPFTLTVNSVNDAPEFTLSSPAITVDEDFVGTESVTVTPGTIPTNELGQTVTYSISPDPSTISFATVSINSVTGEVSASAVADASGSASFTVTATDDGGTPGVNMASQPFTLTVNSVNDAPEFTLSSPSIIIDEDFVGTESVTVTPGTIPTNELGQTVTYSISPDPSTVSFANISINSATGEVSASAVADASGSLSFTVTATDDGGTPGVNMASQPFTLTVNSVNDAPVFTLSSPSVTVDEDFVGTESITVTPGAIPTNELSQTVTYSMSPDPSTVSFANISINSSTGEISASAVADASGSLSFTVTATDNGGTPGVNTASQPFTLTVNSVNDAPTFSLSSSTLNLEEDFTGSQIVTVTPDVVPADEAGQTVTYSMLPDPSMTGFANVAINPSNGQITVSSIANLSGSRSFTVVATDNGSAPGNTATQPFILTVNSVNDAPDFALSRSVVTVNEDFVGTQSVSVTPFAVPADEVSQPVSYSISPSSVPFANINFNSANGGVDITAIANASGSQVFTITANDNQTENNLVSKDFTLTVNPINDAPSFSKGPDVAVGEDSGAQTINGWATNINEGAIGEGDQTLTFNASIVGTSGSIAFSVSPSIDENGTLTFTPALNTNGSATIEVSLQDSGSGTPPNNNTSPTQTFVITINPVNDAPVFVRGPDQLRTEDDGAVSVTGWATGIGAGGGSDESSQATSFVVSPISSSGNLAFAATPQITPTGTLSYSLTPNTNGIATFSVVLMDNGSGFTPNINVSSPITLTITVGDVNDEPSFSPGPNQSIAEDAGLQLVNSWATNLSTGGGTDEATQQLTFNTSVNVTSGNLAFETGPNISSVGDLSYQTALNTFGTAQVSVTLNDNGSNTAPNDNQSTTSIFTVNVSPVQDDPVFTSAPVTGAVQGVLYQYNITTVDPDPSDALTITNIIALPSWLSIQDNGNGTALLSGTPTNSDIGTVGIALRVQDNNGNNDTQFFDIEVSNSNDTPFFTSLPITSATEGVGYTYLITADDDDTGDNLFITAPIAPAWLTIQDNLDGTASLTGTPQNGDIGNNQVQINVRDNSGAFENQDFTIVVQNTNQPPEFTSSPVTSALEDNLYTYNIIATDPDAGDVLSIRALSKPDWLTLTDNGNGSATLSGTPENEDVGNAGIVINVEDNNGANVNQNFTVAVTNTNDPPLFTSSPVTAALQGVEYEYNIATGDPDIGDSRVISSQTLPSWLTLDDNGNGTARLYGTPSNSDFGTNPVVIRVTDIAGSAIDQSFNINVDNANDPPQFSSTPITSGIEDQVYSYNISTTDPDVNDTRVISALSIPDWLTLSDFGNGTANLSGTPLNEDVESFSIVLNVRDALGANSNQNFTLTISNTNDDPFFNSTPITSALQGVQYNYNVQATDIDDGDQVTLSGIIVPSWLTFTATGAGTGTLSGTPSNANLGSNTVRIRASDQNGANIDQTFVIEVNNANDPPSFTSSPLLMGTEDQLYNYNITTNDPDAGDVLEIRALVIPDWLSLLDNGDGTAQLSGTPLNEDVGISSLVLNVEDAQGANSNQNFSITIQNTNDPPVFVSSPVTGAIQDQSYVYNITTTDPDNGDSRTFTEVMTASWLSLTDNGNGTARLSGTPTNADLGLTDIVLRVTDVSGAAVDQTFTINVDNANDPPVFTSTPVTDAIEDVAYEYTITTSDPDISDTRSITLLSNPPWLSLDDNGDGTALLSGTPTNDEVGAFTLVINVEDAIGASVNQNFTVTVSNTNDPPLFTSTPIQVALQDVQYTYNIETSDPDVGDSRMISATQLPSWLSFQDNGNGTGLITGTPTNSELGLHDVVVEVEDNSGAAVSQVFTINVDNTNDPPSFVSSPVLSVLEDDEYQYIVVTEDPDQGDLGVITALSIPNWLTLTDNGNNTALLSGTPLNEDVGTVSIALNVRDGIGANVNQNFTITVSNSNDAPFFVSSPITGAIQAVNYTYDIQADDVDAGDVITVEGIVVPSWLTFSDAGNGMATLSGIPSNSDFGANQVTLRVTDNSGASVDQVFTINVDNANDPPSFTSSPITMVDEDESYIYNISTDDPDLGDTRTISGLSLPAWLTLTDNNDGTGSLHGTPENADVGNTDIVLNVSDALGANVNQNFTIVVTNVNDAPSFTSTPLLTAVQDLPYDYAIFTTDPDVGDVIDITATTLPGWLSFMDNGDGTGSLSGTPTNADFGMHDVVLNVEDQAGAAVEQIFTIDVGNANDAPVFDSSPTENATEDVFYAYNILTSDLDIGDTRTIVAQAKPDWLDLIDNGDGTAVLRGTPLNADVGMTNIVLNVRDAAGANTSQNFTITVANVNDDPGFSSTPLTTAQQSLEYTYNIVTFDPDAGDTRTIVSNPLPGWLTLTDNGNGTARLNGTPENSDLGVHPIILTVTDAAGSNISQSFDITVDNTNDPPLFVTNPIEQINEDQAYNYMLEVNDPDVGDMLTLAVLELPSWLTFTDNGDNTAIVSGTPNNSQVGVHPVSIQVTDVIGQAVRQDFNITVINTNDEPVFNTSPITQTNEDELYEYTIGVSDVDMGDVVTLSTPTLPSWLTFDVPSATISGTPSNDEVGTFTITIRADDSNGGIVDQIFLLTVINVNDLPIFESAPILSVDEDSQYIYNVVASDPDEGDNLSISLVSLPQWLTLTDNGNGTAVLQGIPENADVGDLSVTLVLDDDASSEIEQNFTITVNNTNDPPQFESTPVTKVALGEVYSYQVSAIDVDRDDVLTLSGITIPSFLTFVDNGNGTGLLTGTVTNQLSTENQVSLRVTDLDGAFVEQNFEFTLNAPPILSDASVEIDEDNLFEIPLSNFESVYQDSDSDPIVNIRVEEITSSGLLLWNGTPIAANDTIEVENGMLTSFSYQPNRDFNGVDAFRWNAFDGTAYSDNNANFNITILNVNDIPVLTIAGNESVQYSLGDPATAVIDTTLTINDVDNTTMMRATLQVTDNYSQGDVLMYDDTQNMAITSSFNSSNGTLLLEGEDSRSNYELALRQVLFSSPVSGAADLSDKRILIIINDGLADSEAAERIVQITEIFPEIDLVNSFTPNGDGVNDTWDFTNLQFYTDIAIKIFNQQGELVFECNTEDCEWDGTYNGQELPAGSYFYTIDLNNGKRENKGTVTILK